MGSNDLSFCGWRATEWNQFISALRSADISLIDELDSLLWARGDATGIISVKNIYDALLKQLNLGADNSWYLQLWNWDIPLKYKLFLWLAGKEKILSWELLRRRGWEGPEIFPLCRRASEDIHHLLVHCEFTKEVWNRLLKHFTLPFSWSGVTISDCFNSWNIQNSSSICLAAHVCWQL
jgi:hypothetical protein